MDDLVRMMNRSLAVLVPVFVGEGSNLKSADALASGAPVIMTERATRGYEKIIEASGDGITVVRSASEFRTAMTSATSASNDNGHHAAERRRRLTWPERLIPLVETVADTTVEFARSSRDQIERCVVDRGSEHLSFE